MPTEFRDRVIELWRPIGAMPDQFVTKFSGRTYERETVLHASHALLHRMIGYVAFDLARFADGGVFIRPDLAAELCFHLQQFPTLLTDTFTVGDERLPILTIEQWTCFRTLLERYIDSSEVVLVGEVRTPWNDEDFRLFASRLITFVQSALHAYFV